MCHVVCRFVSGHERTQVQHLSGSGPSGQTREGHMLASIRPCTSFERVSVAAAVVAALLFLPTQLAAQTLPAITATPSAVTVGSTIAITWQGIAAPTTIDWFGLFPTGASDTGY